MIASRPSLGHPLGVVTKPDSSHSRTMSATGGLQCRCSAVSHQQQPQQQRSVPELNDGIAKFYDSSSKVWEDMWGEHMHHGYYDTEEWSWTGASAADNRRAQVRMIEETLAWAGISGDLKCPACLTSGLAQSVCQSSFCVGCPASASARAHACLCVCAFCRST